MSNPRREPLVQPVMPRMLAPGQFYGTETRRRGCADVKLSETVYPPSFQIAEHAHARPYFCLVIDGSFEEIQAQCRPHLCGPARVIFHSAAEAHANHFGLAGGRCFNVELGPAWASRLEEVDCRDQFDARVPATAGLLAGRLYDEFCSPTDLAPLVIEGLALALVGELDRAWSAHEWRGPTWLREVLEYIDSHFREHLSVERLAATAGVNVTHLSRTFGRRFGVTIGEHVRLRRVAWARHQVVHTARPLSEIALEAGFSDQAHFARVFKQVTRLSPRQLRQAPQPSRGSLA
jgi:AraC family transcriptional regulator